MQTLDAQGNSVLTKRHASAVSALPLLPVALALALLPAWTAGGASYRADVLGTLVSPYLPLAMGMLLMARAGVVDLSVWGVASLSTALVWVLAARPHPGWDTQHAVVLAMAVGGLIGLLQAGILRLLRIPTILLTAAVGAAAMAGARALVSWAHPPALQWEQLGLLRLAEIRYFLSAAMFAAALAAILMAAKHSRSNGSREIPIWLACLGSGVLSAGGGAILLLSQLSWHSQAYLFGDLRVLAAVMLAGGWTWRRPGGAVLAGVLLPVAFMAGTLWRQMVWDLGPAFWPDNEGSLVILMLMVAGVQEARRGKDLSARLYAAVQVLTWMGLLICAMAAYFPAPATDLGRYIQYLGGALWLAGILLRWLPRKGLAVGKTC